MSKFIETIRKFLAESPHMTEGGSDQTYWRTISKGIKYNHDKNGEVLSDEKHHVTRVSVEPEQKYQEFHRQYGIHENGGIVFRADFKNHSLSSHPKLRGTYSSLILKINPADNAKSFTKAVYDHELSNHDYLISDANQYEGGKYIWKNLTKQYESEGKNLYLHDGEKLAPISHSEILDRENEIWGHGDEFKKRRLIVSNRKL